MPSQIFTYLGGALIQTLTFGLAASILRESAGSLATGNMNDTPYSLCIHELWKAVKWAEALFSCGQVGHSDDQRTAAPLL